MHPRLLSSLTKYSFSFTYPCPRKLREVMKLSAIERQPTHQIKEIWQQYHASRPENIATSLDKEEYIHLLNRVKKAPMFLLPVHRKGGHFKIITQWQDNCFLCTSMEDFKKYGGRAHPYAVFTLFSELLFLKGIALARGDILNSMLTKLETEKLWATLYRSYQEQERFEMVDCFNNRPEMFSQQAYDRLYGIS